MRSKPTVSPVNLDIVTIEITSTEAAALLESASDLIGVKSDAVEHAERTMPIDQVRRRQIDGHRGELDHLTRIAEDLERASRGGRSSTVHGSRGTMDEIIVGALITHAEWLSDDVMGLQGTSDLRDVRRRLDTLRALVETLADMRA